MGNAKKWKNDEKLVFWSAYMERAKNCVGGGMGRVIGVNVIQPRINYATF